VSIFDAPKLVMPKEVFSAMRGIGGYLYMIIPSVSTRGNVETD
jgi:hypothetical protein